MLKMKIVAVIVAFCMLAQVPVVTLAGAQELDSAPAQVQGPKVAASATPLTADELARYGQLQADAQRKGVLNSEKGGSDAVTWTIIGVVAVVCVGVGIGVAIANGD